MSSTTIRIAIGFVVVAFIGAVAYAIGGLWNMLFAAGMIAITFYASASVLRELYAGNALAAVQHQLHMLFNLTNGFVIVDDGKIVLPQCAGPHLGPMVVIVRPGNAVVMTSGGTMSRICGPSIFRSKNFEYVSRVLPLGKRRQTFTMANVLTNDQLPVDLALSYIYGIGVSDETIFGEHSASKLKDGSCGLTDTERAQLRTLVTGTLDWEQRVRMVVEGATANVVNRYQYSQVLRLPNYQHLADDIAARARGRTAMLGGDLVTVEVGHVAPRTDVIDAIADGERVRTRHLAQGQGFRGAIFEVAHGYIEAAKHGMSLDDIHREASRLMVEHMAADPSAKVVFLAPGQYGAPSESDSLLAGQVEP